MAVSLVFVVLVGDGPFEVREKMVQTMTKMSVKVSEEVAAVPNIEMWLMAVHTLGGCMMAQAS